MAMHKKEFAFVSASADNIKKFSCHGDFMHNMLSKQNSIVNTLSMNDDDFVFSGGDNGSMCFCTTSLGIASNKKRRWCNPVRWKPNAGSTPPLLTSPVRA